MSLCPCGSQNKYELCCGLFLEKKQQPETPEQLMRSRYTAYSMGNIDYIKNTMKGKALMGFNELEAEQWAKSVTWISLDVLNSNTPAPDKGFVEFAARYFEDNRVKIIHELSEFHKEHDQWFYVSGVHKQGLEKTNKPKIARNAPCPCGSGKKFKNCHAK
ncbi:YchJ family protein [Fluoribacter gormanii]|uniref:Predicted metal-binding protein related to the C-terminal domain of SecA n=1 Tax=Fluoribacter gormanii TaxID=464 RepID=A0A377GJV6_9GAMM|nr:YchJ family protein [Fluoribacter gormanii]KTD04281.1 putative SEC-C motif domain protein [Fluoribacter gormanii]SIR74464.1 SEC-C motif-containing protein [Fluoribacter gormanii]STO25107.1 Predicted metal-binding protein related to the C-terminal domain of SecA [Fluoribacter gormanii]